MVTTIATAAAEAPVRQGRRRPLTPYPTWFYLPAAIIYGVLTIAGFVPGLSTLFGLAPLYGADIALHLGSAIIAAYFGWGIAVDARAAV